VLIVILEMKRPSRTQLLYQLALVAISTLVFILYILLATQNHFSQLEPMLDGTASRPYVYRVLIPFTARMLSETLSISPFFSAILIMYVSLLGFAWSMWSLTKVLLPPAYVQRATLLAPIGLIPFLIEQRHMYDFPVLFLFTLALWLLAKNKFGTYIPIFVLATLAKETSLFLIFFFIIQFHKIERKHFLALVFIQLVIYIFIRALLILHFRQNPGGLVEFHFYEHLDAYLEHPAGAIVLFLSIISLMGIYLIDRAEDITFARNAMLAIGGPTLLLYFVFGVPFEVRIFLESYPALVLVTSHAVITFLRRMKPMDALQTKG
jgi:hypothetical protein